MHRTEGLYNNGGLFTDGPPGTRVEQRWLNSVQEEIAYIIEQAGLTLKTAGTDTRTQLYEALEIIYGAQQTTMAYMTLQNGGFWGDIVYKDADEITIIPKAADGVDAFTGAFLNDGTFLYTSSKQTIKLDTPGAGGDILDGITAALNNEWYIVWAYQKSDLTLGFGITWMPYTTFTNANPTTTLTLAQVNAQDIGYLFAPDGHIVVWQDTDELETPYGYNDGGAFTYDLTNDAETSINSRTATVLTLGGTLNNATFLANSTVYQVDGFKPLQVSDGAIASEISTRGYKDIGFRFRTDGSGNIINFVIVDDNFYFDNGSGAADYNNPTGTGWGRFSNSAAWVNYHNTFFVRDKTPIMNGSSINIYVYFKSYWNTYGAVMNTNYNNSTYYESETMVKHAILSTKVNTSAVTFSILGYKLKGN